MLKREKTLEELELEEQRKNTPFWARYSYISPTRIVSYTDDFTTTGFSINYT